MPRPRRIRRADGIAAA